MIITNQTIENQILKIDKILNTNKKILDSKKISESTRTILKSEQDSLIKTKEKLLEQLNIEEK